MRDVQLPASRTRTIPRKEQRGAFLLSTEASPERSRASWCKKATSCHLWRVSGPSRVTFWRGASKFQAPRANYVGYWGA